MLEDGRGFNVAHFAMRNSDGSYVTDDVVTAIELFDPNGASVELTDDFAFGGPYNTLYGNYNPDDGQWYYDEAMVQESWYRVEFETPLIVGTYHLQVTDIDGYTPVLWRACN